MKPTLVFAIIALVLANVGCNTLPMLIEPTATPMQKPALPPLATKPVPSNPNPTSERPPMPPAQKPGGTPMAKPGINGTPPPKPGANITPPAISPGAAKTYSVTNPTTNAKLNVQVFTPKDSTDKKFPTLVLVPGGTGDSGGMIDDATRMASVGIVAVIFDPDGRGKSTGQEDFNGQKQQDGLAAVVRFAATLPEVDAKQIGIATYSYGITMGSGVLARYSDLPVKFLIDWEGPADRNYTTTGCGANRQGGIQWQPCADNAWWSEREAVNFIGKLRVPYQRIQSEKDHVQPNNNHALDMINAAIKGGAPFVRLNNLTSNQTYDVKNPPQMLPDTLDRQLAQTVIQYAQELFRK
ncbi:hypothetical protein ANRL3_02547 [Anaerolineae bacterium]|nr:hypothetical protein ANRL3_02547 [Anaerolineae bacterium]